MCCPQPLLHACRSGWFAVTAACPLGPLGPLGPPCKVVRDQTCASAFDRAPGVRLSLFAGAYRQPLLRRLPKGQDGVIPVPTFGPGGTGRRRWSRGSQVGVAQKMWQNVLKISPLFCGKIFKIFCHGLPAGERQSQGIAIFFPLLTPFLVVWHNAECPW